MTLLHTLWVGAAGALLASLSSAQNFRDLTLVRNRPSPWAEVFQVRAGVLGSIADDENKAIGLESDIGWDGHAYYRNDRFADREAAIDIYAGRDGAYLGINEGTLLGGGSQSRLEVTVRYFPFYREGFYRNDDFIPTGQYEGLDYGVNLAVNREMGENLTIELGGFYRRNTFDRNEQTAANYVIPDDHNTFGARATLEHNTLQLDRLTGRPTDGFILTLAGDYDRNDSDLRFGTTGIWESRLPDGLFRARGALEWYFPAGDVGAWQLFVEGSWSDREDRIYNYDAQKPIGDIWIDGEIGYRLDIGTALAVAPFVQGQFVRAAAESGLGSENEFFFGGGIDAALNLSDELSLVGNYSYLSNESRPSVSTSSDAFGEHIFFFGLETRFGARRR